MKKEKNTKKLNAIKKEERMKTNIEGNDELMLSLLDDLVE